MTEHVQKAVALGDAKSVRAMMQMGFGKLAVRGGADTLMSGHFEFSDPALRPEVTYEVSGGIGDLLIQHPELCGVFKGKKGTCVWDVALGDQAPLELAVRLGSGEADLQLKATWALLFDVVVGSGRVTADLSGATELRHVTAKTGSGQVTLRFDGEYPDLAHVETSVASGVTDLVLDGVYPSLKHLKLNCASGRTGLRLPGAYPALKTVSFNTASGMIDLSSLSALPEDLQIGIHCVSGVATVHVPADLGVAVCFSAISGKVKAPDFQRVNGVYVSKAYQEGGAVIHVKMSTVSGELFLQLAES